MKRRNGASPTPIRWRASPSEPRAKKPRARRLDSTCSGWDSGRPTLDEEQPNKPLSERIAGWVSQPAVSLSLAGAALYVLVRLGQQIFYEQFGLAPEDVGLGYAETLARAAGFATYLVVGIAVMLAVLVWVMNEAYRSRGYKLPVSVVIKSFHFVTFSAIFTVLLVLLGFVTVLANAKRVKQGQAVASYFVFDFGLRGEPTEIAWLDKTGAPEGLAALEDHELMLLDQSGGTVTLYDVTDQLTVQVPSSSVAVSITP